MSKPVRAFITINFMDGTSQRFERIRDVEDEMLIAMMDAITESKVIIIELEDRTVLIPQHNIRSVDISPPIPRLPPRALRGARLLP